LSPTESEPDPDPSPADAPPRTAVSVASFDGGAHDEIDLNAELAGPGQAAGPGGEAGPGEAELGEAFSDFRQEVVRQTGADHCAQHMTIGRTYLEMGMRDQAVEPLTAAARSTQFRFEAASLLGRIFRERGDLDQAIQWFDRAADAPAPSAAEGRTLLYDLGRAVEDRGDTSRALAIFLELRAEAGEYLDVASRIERLSRVEAGG
jgi:tetratricopeptide (TPR) repeat protein